MFTNARAKLELDLPENFASDCADAFYENLWAMIPAARTMFRNEKHMRSMFATTLSVILKDANDPNHLRRQLHNLGLRHRYFGIQPIHIKIGRQAFVDAVNEAAPELPKSDCQFFAKAYDEIADAMSI